VDKQVLTVLVVLMVAFSGSIAIASPSSLVASDWDEKKYQ